MSLNGRLGESMVIVVWQKVDTLIVFYVECFRLFVRGELFWINYTKKPRH